MKLLFVSHPHQQCGVHQYGKMLYQAVAPAAQAQYHEVANPTQLSQLISSYGPKIVFYNYHPATLSFVNPNLIRQFRKQYLGVRHLGFIHEITEAEVGPSLQIFDFATCADPTLQSTSNRMFKTGRIIPKFEADQQSGLNFYHRPPAPIVPTFGSFGFGCPHKGYERLVKLVQQEYDEAIIRINMAFQTPFDANGAVAKQRAAICHSLVKKPGIKLEITHDFFQDHQQLMIFLVQNSLNAFLYDDLNDRGISSTVDFGLAVRRPIAVSPSRMFRHVHGLKPSITVGETNLKQILQNGMTPLERFYTEWTQERVCATYGNILSAIARS